jgi:hypothetical protein
MAQGSLVVAAHAVIDVAAFGSHSGFQFFDLGINRLHFVVSRRKRRSELGVLAAQVGELFLVVFQGIAVEHFRRCFRRAGGGAPKLRLLGEAFRLSFGKLFLHLAKFLFIHAIFFFSGEQQTGRVGVGLKLIFRFLQLDLDVFQLAGEPVAGALSALPTHFNVLLDVFVGQGVGKAGGDSRVDGVAGDSHDTSLRQNADA